MSLRAGLSAGSLYSYLFIQTEFGMMDSTCLLQSAWCGFCRYYRFFNSPSIDNKKYFLVLTHGLPLHSPNLTSDSVNHIFAWQSAFQRTCVSVSLWMYLITVVGQVTASTFFVELGQLWFCISAENVGCPLSQRMFNVTAALLHSRYVWWFRWSWEPWKLSVSQSNIPQHTYYISEVKQT